MSKDLKRRVASLAAAGVVLVSASGCRNINFGPDSIIEYFLSDCEKEEKKDEKDKKAEEYRQECEEFRKKYILEDYTGGSYGPFNFFGIPNSAYEANNGAHSLFDKNELYLGNNVVDFDYLKRLYEQGKTNSQIGGTFSTDWLDISINPDGVHRYHSMDIDKSLTFPITSTEDVVMYSMCGTQSFTLSLEKRTNGVSDFIRVMEYTVDENDKLVLSSDRITHLYRKDDDTAFMTIERFSLVSRKLEDGSIEKSWHNRTDISLRYEGGRYKIYGPLNVSSVLDNSYEIVSNYDAVNGIGQYENTFLLVDKSAFEDIREDLMTMDFGQVSGDFQSVIKEHAQKPKTYQKEYQQQ